MKKHQARKSKKQAHRTARAMVPQQMIQEILMRGEERYRTLTDHIGVGIFRSTPGPCGAFIEVNPALVRMLGYTTGEELRAIPVKDIYQHPEARKEFSEKMCRQGSVKHEEIALKKKDGTPIIVSETATVVRDANGEIEFFDGIIEDITERKKAERELLLQKIYFEGLFNNAPEAIALHGNDDRILNVNDEFVRVFGYSREEAIGKQINELVASREVLEEATDISRRVISGEKIDLETRRKRKDGSMIDVSILGAPIFHEGKQIGDYAIYRDITGRKRSEWELRVQKAYFEKLFDSAPEAIVLHDNNDIIVNVNEEFIRMFGYDRLEAIGQPLNDLVASEKFANEAAVYSQMVIHGERVEAESKRKRKDGTLIDVSILGAPIFDGEKQIGVYAIYRDITERKKTEETRIRLREESRMARNIQMNFLPKANPKIAGYDIAGKSIPALNVGGDYFDFVRLDDHRLVIGLGDVSGNGLAAALVMANLQATIRGQTFFDPNPKKCLERANVLLFRSTDSRTFVSLFYGILDIQHHTLRYANAGQNLPLVFSTDKTPVSLNTRGIALGIKERVSYEEEEISLHPGDRLLVYTDGITEAMDEKMNEFGEKQLKEVIQSHSPETSLNTIERVLMKVGGHAGAAPQGDDMTLVLLKRKDDRDR